MPHPYLAVTAALIGQQSERGNRIADRLAARRMVARTCVGSLVLFCHQQAPILEVPGGGVLLGELYDRRGQRVTDLSPLHAIPTQPKRRAHLLAHYWGEYLLFQPVDEGSNAFCVLRDPSGALECAYLLQGQRGFVTSDLAIATSLDLHAGRIDWDYIQHALRYPHLKIARTGLREVTELLPGCLLTVDGNHARTSMAWSPWQWVEPGQRLRDANEAARLVGEATRTVVQAMARTDGHVLLELSGGLDSSIVGACLAQTGARLSCFTAVTPVPGADERRYAVQVARVMGCRLLESTLDYQQASTAFVLPRHSLRPAAWALSRAVGVAVDRAAASQQAGSLFSGGGGDTVFGYLSSAAPAADAFRQAGLAQGLRAISDLSALHGCTWARAARLTVRNLLRPPKPACSPNLALLPAQDTTESLESHPWHHAPAGNLAGDRERIFDLASTQLFRDATLRASGRRIRMPLLAQPVMEACLRIPSWMWIDRGRNRAVARDAFAGVLPPEVLHRRSKGSFMNYSYAVYRRNTDEISHFLLEGRLTERGLLDRQALRQVLAQTPQAGDQAFMRVFDFCMIENWIRNHG
ncbi:asparagine synthase (glutamine-hydrolysing) [Pseudoxanthomonas sp. GM95]|uniref:asparagine synthase-related protein n=1 Tax=Pseudoxanthomonas sp. GM95 TaxID=1881043 RepID=UPI0008B4142E|nr:asparagine synthase C-terminal domain-containing protein [Pseudoxanthomonas sp. GM95]SEM51659.1 asparagine synthase (glutamine-hydrolysing) [Pseudoxanthomonas sp. GM95]